MRGESDPQATAKMQLDIIDAQLRRLTRQRTIVASALEATSDAQVTDRTGGVPAFIAAQRLLLDALR